MKPNGRLVRSDHVVGNTTWSRRFYGHPYFPIPHCESRNRLHAKKARIGKDTTVQTQSFLQSFKVSFRRGLVAACLLICGTASALETGSSMRISWDPNTESDLAGYTVCLGTVSGDYSDVRTVTSNSIIISDLAPFTTYYCVVRAYNSYGLSSEYSEEIMFSSDTAGEFFAGWAATYGLSGDAALPSASPSNDGLSNLLKFAFNLDPSRPDNRALVAGTGDSGLPAYSVLRDGSTTWFQVEYIRRKASDMSYAPVVTTDLKTYEPMLGTSTVTSIDNTFERVITRQTVDLSKTTKLFGRVEVTLP